MLEMSHRSASFQEIIDNAEATLRRIMNIPEDYAVLFMQGGATLQFSAVAMNLAAQGQKAAYAVTGQFSKKAYQEAKKLIAENEAVLHESARLLIEKEKLTREEFEALFV